MIRGSTLLGGLLAASLLFSGCKGGTEQKDPAGKEAVAAQDIGEVLATVNGMPVGSKELNEAMARSTPRREGEEETQDEAAKKKEALDRLIADKLLYQEALRQGLDQDPRIQKMMVNSLLRKDVYGSVKTSDISEEELKAYFEQHQDEFIVPEKVQVRRILIRIDEDTTADAAKARVEELVAKIKGGAEFKDVAMEYSEDPYARRGGDLGFISDKGKPGLDPVVVQKAFATANGEMSEVFQTEEGFNVVQVVNRREKIERTFDQMKGAVLRKVKTDKYKQLYDDYVAKLRTTATVSVDEAALASFKVEAPATQQGPRGGKIRPGMPAEGGMAPAEPIPAGEGAGGEEGHGDE